jgi:hypothetical protein
VLWFNQVEVSRPNTEELGFGHKKTHLAGWEFLCS